MVEIYISDPSPTWRERGFCICLVGVNSSAMNNYPCWHKKQIYYTLTAKTRFNVTGHPHILNYGSAVRIPMIMLTFMDSPWYKICFPIRMNWQFSKSCLFLLLRHAKINHIFCVCYQENQNCYCFLFIVCLMVAVRPQTYQTVHDVKLVVASSQNTTSCGRAKPPTHAKQYAWKICHGFEIF